MENIKYYYRSRRENSTLTVRLRIKNTNKVKLIEGKTQISVNRKYWFDYHLSKRIKDYEMKSMQIKIHSHLNNLSKHLDNQFNTSIISDIDKDWLQNQIDLFYNPNLAKNIPLDLISYCVFYLEFRKNEIRNTTVQKFDSLKKRLKKLEVNRGNKILIKNINENFKNEFVDFMLKNHYAQNTIYRDVVFIKTLCFHAETQGLTFSPQFKKMKVAKGNPKILYLKKKELKKISKLKNIPEHLEITRNWLIISCYTGQRISDFMKFSKKDISGKKKKYIEITQQKTKKRVCIPIFEPVLKVLKSNGGSFPPKMSHKKYNKHLKTLCEMAGIDKVINASKFVETSEGSGIFRKKEGYYKKYEVVSSHIGRRTFATLLYEKISTPLIIQITGHSSEAMLLNYIGKTKKSSAKAALKAVKKINF